MSPKPTQEGPLHCKKKVIGFPVPSQDLPPVALILVANLQPPGVVDTSAKFAIDAGGAP
jgi:hypothetical protein